ncbi:MAG: hypothetical protein KAH30_04510 [Caldisericia bacterium]|nr:hypothetical protein [Caldisericia bacterium]
MGLLPTYQDLFGSESEAVLYYKGLFPNTGLSDTEISQTIHISFVKIEPLFGEFRSYTVGEETVRNEHIKRAVCFEVNAIEKANAISPLKIENGGLNSNESGTGRIISEKVEDVAVTYDKAESGLGLGSDSLTGTLGLLSSDASILLSRYIRKTYSMGTRAVTGINPDSFCQDGS